MVSDRETSSFPGPLWANKHWSFRFPRIFNETQRSSSQTWSNGNDNEFVAEGRSQDRVSFTKSGMWLHKVRNTRLEMYKVLQPSPHRLIFLRFRRLCLCLCLSVPLSFFLSFFLSFVLSLSLSPCSWTQRPTPSHKKRGFYESRENCPTDVIIRSTRTLRSRNRSCVLASW